MKRLLILMVALGVFAATVTVSAQEQKKARNVGDFVKELMALSGADSADRNLIEADRSEKNYLFVKLLKGNKVIGYGTWAKDVKIYSHFEDLIAVVNPDGTLQNFSAIDANERHTNLKDPKWKGKFIGMNYKRDFNQSADVASGSTFSSMMFITELKGMLFAFDKYVLQAGKLK